MSAKTLGAPAQHKQPSRKGKKAWRKHVDIDEIETGLDSLHDEEILTGTQLHKKTNEQLFQIDLKGDEQLKRSLPKYDRSQLMSTKVLAQRSALPAMFSRPSSGVTTWSSSRVTHKEKGRLLRIGKRPVKGPFNALVDPTEFGAGSAILEPTEAVKKSGTYDVWADPTVENQVVLQRLMDKGKYKDPEEFLLPLVQRPKVKAPETFHPHRSIDLPAIAEPHQGTSYNPPLTAHQELLLSAHENELRREAEAAKFAGVKERFEAARHTLVEGAELGASGMVIDGGDHTMEEDRDAQEVDIPTSRVPPRKTEKQRRKAAQILAERRALLEARHHRRFLAAVPSAKLLRKQVAASLRMRQAALSARRVARADLLRQRGLVGQRLGKHRVQEGQVDVQLGEELSESLRGLKPQGNLFRDRFLSLQHRALVEPRVPVLPKRHRTKIKEYEKHAWKRFE